MTLAHRARHARCYAEPQAKHLACPETFRFAQGDMRHVPIFCGLILYTHISSAWPLVRRCAI